MVRPLIGPHGHVKGPKIGKSRFKIKGHSGGYFLLKRAGNRLVTCSDSSLRWDYGQRFCMKWGNFPNDDPFGWLFST